MSFAEKLEEIMEYAHLTQTDIADKLGVTQAHVSALLSGKRQPSRKLEQRLKEKFMIFESWWVSGEGEIMSEDYFEDEERKERYEGYRKIIEIFYLPETVSIADEIDCLIYDMSQRERTKIAAKIFDFLEQLSANVNSGDIING